MRKRDNPDNWKKVQELTGMVSIPAETLPLFEDFLEQYIDDCVILVPRELYKLASRSMRGD